MLVEELELVLEELLEVVEVEEEDAVESEDAEFVVVDDPTRLVAARNADDALMAEPALAAPVPSCVALPAAGVVVALLEVEAVVAAAPLVLAVGLRVPRRRGAVSNAYFSALVIPVIRMVFTSEPCCTFVVRMSDRVSFSLA